MARPRNFDPDIVLSAAMHRFRRDGYERVSIKDLEDATGLTSGSLYNTFGSKDGVFRAALDHYLGAVVRTRLQAFAGSGATLDDLEQLFLSVWEMPQADGYGCLVTNSAVEFGPQAPGFAADKVAEGLDLAAAGIRSVLERALSPSDAGAASSQLTLLYHGMLVLSRSGTLSEAHREAVRTTFDQLREKAVDRPEKH